MPLRIVRNDITKMRVDAIVNPTSRMLNGVGGTDGSIRKAAGPELDRELKAFGSLRPGEARITGGYLLPAKHIIHTAGPVWLGGHFGEAEKLQRCYLSCLEMACTRSLDTLAIPLISSGRFGYPKKEAFEIASRTIQHFLKDHEITVYLVVYDAESFAVGQSYFSDIRKYIDDNSIKAPSPNRRPAPEFIGTKSDHTGEAFSEVYTDCGSDDISESMAAPPPRSLFSREEYSPISFKKAAQKAPSEQRISNDLHKLISQIDESFSQMLLRKIDELGLKDSECYKKANIDRKLFSKIRSDPHYKPSKPTALAFAIALELDIAQTQDLLSKAGFTLSGSSKFDIIIEYFISHRIYNIHAINEALFAFDQSLLGA